MHVLSLLFAIILGTIAATAQEPVRLLEEKVGLCANPCDRLALVFIHGLTGSEETWKHESGAYWPALVGADSELGESLDIYRVDYDSFYRAESPSISALVKALAHKLDPVLRGKNYQRVAIIAHSLGGIVALSYLHHLKSSAGHREMARVRLVMTYGAPLRGGNFAGFGRWLSNNPQLRILVKFNENDFQQFLTDRFSEALEKRERFGCPALNLHAAFEEAPMGNFVGMLVERDSATAFATHPGDIRQGFALNHVDLVKPPDRDAPVHLWTKSALKKCLAGDGLCAGRLGPDCR